MRRSIRRAALLGALACCGTWMMSSAATAQDYAPLAPRAYYFPLAGYYNTTAGVVWVPAPGYYHVVPTQYYPPATYRGPATWRRAHPAPPPDPPAGRYTRPDLSGIHTEYFWHPRAMGEPLAHEAWIRGQLRQKHARSGRY